MNGERHNQMHLITKCTCLAEKERQETKRTGYVKLFHIEEGYDEDGNPCPLHDLRREPVSDLKKLEEARKDRGNQLRALVVSWDEDKTFLEALTEQQAAMDAGKFAPSDGWAVMADELLGQYMSVRAQKVAELEAQKNDGPKLIWPT